MSNFLNSDYQDLNGLTNISADEVRTNVLYVNGLLIDPNSTNFNNINCETLTCEGDLSSNTIYAVTSIQNVPVSKYAFLLNVSSDIQSQFTNIINNYVLSSFLSSNYRNNTYLTTNLPTLAAANTFTGNNTFSAETTFLAKTKFENEVDITKGNSIKVNGNIIMNGVSGTNGNYLQFPDGSTQNTAAATPDNVAILENNQEFSGINTFTNNNVFSGNNTLGGANNFNGANIFSNANTFSGDNTFTKANTFSGNNTFTVGNTFSGPNTFSGENSFTNANTFSGDNTFTKANTFSGNNTFTVGNTFSGPNTFSGENSFTNANTFSGDNTFTKANTFSGNNTFTVGNTFSGPNTFSGENSFTNANTFSGENSFTNANTFSGNNTFTVGNTFSGPNTFSGENSFTNANTFSGNNTFTVGNTFSGPNTFSGENSFTNANTFGGNNTFSGDNTFSGENNFTAKTTFKNDVDIKDNYGINVNGNIIMNGASGTNGNYLEFPDGSQQTTAYTGSTGGVTGGVAILDASGQTFSGVNTFSNTNGGIKVAKMNLNNNEGIDLGTLTINSDSNFEISSTREDVNKGGDLILKSARSLYISGGNPDGDGIAITTGTLYLDITYLVEMRMHKNTDGELQSTFSFDTNDNFSRMTLYNNNNEKKGYLAIINNSGYHDLVLESVSNLYIQAGPTSNNSLTISGTNISLNLPNNYIKINNSVDYFINFGFPVTINNTPTVGTLLTFLKDGGSGGGAISFNNKDTNGIAKIYADEFQSLNLSSNQGSITLTSKIKQYSLNGASNVDIYEWTDGIYAFILFNSNSSNDGYCEFIINKDLNVSILAIGGGADGGYGMVFNARGGGGGGGGGLISANAQLKKSASPYIINIGGSTSGNSPENGKDCEFVNEYITVKATGGKCPFSPNTNYGGDGGVPIGSTNDPIPALHFNYLTNGQKGGDGSFGTAAEQSIGIGLALPSPGGSTFDPNPYPGPGIGISWGNGGGGGATYYYNNDSSLAPNKGGYGGNNGGANDGSGNGGTHGGGGGGGGAAAGSGAPGIDDDPTSASGGNGGNSPCSYTNKAGSYGQGGGGAGWLDIDPPENQFGRGSPGCVLITMLTDDIYDGIIIMDTQFSKPLPLSNNYNLVWNSETQELYKDPNRIQSGVVGNISSLFDDTNYYYSITFSVAFSDIPNVVCNLGKSTSGKETSSYYAIYSFIYSISTTGFKFYVIISNTVVTQPWDLSVNWIARLSS
jgi:hypothetical protein